MELCLAGVIPWNGPQYWQNCKPENASILQSFYYQDPYVISLIPRFHSFMLDSGAFTFMMQGGGQTDWDGYVERFAEFIVKHKVDLFFELDIDSIVGYSEVIRLRKKLEKLTGKQVIPVWHKSRGKENFIRMCQEYKYVAIGGIVSGEITRDQYKYFPHFISTAHQYGAKIHGLGFTNLEGLKKYHFDSVDSTAWVSGNRFGAVYRFNGQTMVKLNKPDGYRLKDSKMVAINNFNEWVKFSMYARRHL